MIIKPEWAYRSRELLASHAAITADIVKYGDYYDALARSAAGHPARTATGGPATTPPRRCLERPG